MPKRSPSLKPSQTRNNTRRKTPSPHTSILHVSPPWLKAFDLIVLAIRQAFGTRRLPHDQGDGEHRVQGSHQTASRKPGVQGYQPPSFV